MAKTEITAHMVVKNEDRFIWYAISSIINYVDQLIIFDTGSEDQTVPIILSFKSPKIIFEEKRNCNAKKIVSLRQEQIERTITDWFWVVDGDEIYPSSTAREIIDLVSNKKRKYFGGVVRRYDLLGDIYHYQSESVGEYRLFGKKGHLVLRLINKSLFPGLKIKGQYPYEGYYDKNGIPLIEYSPADFFITKNRLFHTTYLKRSSLGENLIHTLHRNKFKVEIGNRFPQSTDFPEVFSKKRPTFIPQISVPRNSSYKIRAAIVTPLKIIKRQIKKN